MDCYWTSKRLKGKKCFKWYGYGHFQEDYPNRRTLSIREVEEIQSLEEEISEEEFEEEDHTAATSDVGELLVIRRALYAKEVPLEPSQRERIFHTWYTIGGKVCELIIDGGSCTNVASMTLIDKLQVCTKVRSTPYTVQWLKQGSEVTVSKQVFIAFLMWLHYGEVLCVSSLWMYFTCYLSGLSYLIIMWFIMGILTPMHSNTKVVILLWPHYLHLNPINLSRWREVRKAYL